MKVKKTFIIILSLLLIISSLSVTQVKAYSPEQATLTFNDSSITETVAGSGYSIEGTVLTIESGGTYRINGSCSDGSIVVGKGLSGVTLILDSLTLASASTAPIVIKKTSTVLILLKGTSTLTDNEDASTEETNADFEGAAIKFKSGSTLVIAGDGTLNIAGNAKNGIKGGAESALTIDGGVYNVTCANNGIAADGSVVINAGTFTIDSENDGIKSVPDDTDTASAGTIEINGGTFTIHAQGDGIQAGSDLTVTNGTFDITTLDGYNSTSFDSDTMSCKGLKASGGSDDTGTETDTSEATNTITVSGGTFHLNTADDAVHSDAYIVITGGSFYIYTGDDAVHSDTTLTLGSENGLERDPYFMVYTSYEGLESGNLYIYSGRYNVYATDDGINAAGGSSNGTNPGGGGNFNPGQPGGASAGNYSINIYGGEVYVDCLGDGLDSNGDLNLYGGTVTVMSQAYGGDNSPLDADGSILIKGATVFAAGTNPMNENPSSSSQKYYVRNTTYSADTVINISYGGSVVFSEKLVRRINYLLYSSPDMTNTSCSLTTGNLDSCNSDCWKHSWDDGTVTVEPTTTSTGIMTYTCKLCGETERQTIPAVLTVTEYTEEEAADEGYAVTFELDGKASVNIYYTQDYSAPDESGVTTAVSRNADTGEPDSTGSGQVNFEVVCSDGYAVSDVSVTGSYKNLKDVGDGFYRVTKVTSDLTITVTTESESTADIIRLYGSDRYETAIANADYLKEILGATSFDSIIVACGTMHPDALTGSYLAAVKKAPILLVSSKGTGLDLAADYIEANLSADGTVYILGGTAAVPETVEASISELRSDASVVRLCGDTRYETNLSILEEAGITGNTLLVCDGVGFADALSASALGLPIMIVQKKSLTEEQITFLESHTFTKVYILGGSSAVSESIESALSDVLESAAIERLYGSTRYETTVAVAEAFFTLPDTIVLATGKNFPDGLSGGIVAYSMNAPLILTSNADYADAAAYASENAASTYIVLGGTGALSEDTVSYIVP